MTRWALLSTTSWEWWEEGRCYPVWALPPLTLLLQPQPHAQPQPHLQLGEVGSPVWQQLHRPALQAQGLLPLGHAELRLPTLGLHLVPRDSQAQSVGGFEHTSQAPSPH